MSVYSMTGFGTAAQRHSATTDAPSQTLDGGALAGWTVDLRSVNGRFLDITIKLPDEIRALEGALRDLISSRLKRGKVEMRVSLQRDADSQAAAPTPEQLLQLARIEATVRAYFDQAQPMSVADILQWSRQAQPAARNDDALLKVASQAVDALMESRRREGDKLAKVLRAGAARVRELAVQAAPLVPAAVQRQQQRFVERWSEALKLVPQGTVDASSAAATERALAEAATYALRIDVSEELTRLQAHLDELDALLKRGGELGKRLDFLVQELHREANTLGAKSQVLELSNVSMEMRVTIEQMREQVQNLE